MKSAGQERLIFIKHTSRHWIFCKKLTRVCFRKYNWIYCERKIFSSNTISFKVKISILEIPIYYRLINNAHFHYPAIFMSDNQVVEKDSITIHKALPTAVVSLHIFWQVDNLVMARQHDGIPL